jgi:hypothetical protein
MIFLVPDLRENLAKVDKFVVDLNQEIDQLIVEKTLMQKKRLLTQIFRAVMKQQSSKNWF